MPDREDGELWHHQLIDLGTCDTVRPVLKSFACPACPDKRFQTQNPTNDETGSLVPYLLCSKCFCSAMATHSEFRPSVKWRAPIKSNVISIKSNKGCRNAPVTHTPLLIIINSADLLATAKSENAFPRWPVVALRAPTEACRLRNDSLQESGE